MDLVGIFHMVDMLSSGKCDFNHIYVVVLIQSIMIQFILILFLSGVHLMFMFWYGYCPRNAGFCHHFLIVCFSQIQGVVLYSVDMCASHLPFGFPWMTMV